MDGAESRVGEWRVIEGPGKARLLWQKLNKGLKEVTSWVLQAFGGQHSMEKEKQG